MRGASSSSFTSNARDSWFATLVDRPLTIVIGLMCLSRLATWVPHYLTWPWWADHDVFATAARSWDAGILPYRDFQGNNFPGSIYLFWILGRLFGWGRTAPLFAVDAGLVGLLGLLLVAWSRRRLGKALPGLVGYLMFLGYYLTLDYSLAAQRDWHAPLFMVAGLLIYQVLPNRAGRWISALAAAVAFAIRPQVILLAPGVLVAIRDDARSHDRQPGRTWKIAGEWAVVSASGLVLVFLPLLAAGVFDDFLRALGTLRPGGHYNEITRVSLLRETTRQFLPMWVAAVPVGLLLLWRSAGPHTRRVGLAWVAAFLGCVAYRPLSPQVHAYLTHPLMLVWSILAAVLVSALLDNLGARPSLRLAFVLLLLGTSVPFAPRFSTPLGIRDAVAVLRGTGKPDFRPTGYVANPEVLAAAKYEWDDYRNLLAYLRSQVPASTKVANALQFVPAVAGPTGRLSAFPAESIAWLRVVDEDAEESFVNALAAAADSVVVWAPSEPDSLPRLTAAIKSLYEPARRFGPIEVWSRRR